MLECLYSWPKTGRRIDCSVSVNIIKKSFDTRSKVFPITYSLIESLSIKKRGWVTVMARKRPRENWPW